VFSGVNKLNIEKFSLVVFALVFLTIFIPNLSAANEPGRCSGVEDYSAPQMQPTPERIALEEFCEKWDDNRRGCQAERRCVWHPKPKECEARSRPGRTNEADEDFCRLQIHERDCLRNSSRCEWIHRKPRCNAKDTQKQADIDFCEAFDENERSCELNEARCDWG
jgi:hypothetical protein